MKYDGSNLHDKTCSEQRGEQPLKSPFKAVSVLKSHERQCFLTLTLCHCPGRNGPCLLVQAESNKDKNVSDDELAILDLQR